jgi:cytochrome c553
MLRPIFQALGRTSDYPMKIAFQNVLATAAVLLLILPVIASAKGNPAAGQEKSTTCLACHGDIGIPVDPNYPKLAGQHKDYIIKALSDYRSRKRTNPIMANFAAQLSNQDIEDLAAWFSSQEGLQDLSVR